MTPSSERGDSQSLPPSVPHFKLLANSFGCFVLLFFFLSAMMWLSLSLELLYVGLLLISCILLSVQLCIRAWFPSTQRCGQLLNAFAAVFTVLGGAELLYAPFHVTHACGILACSISFDFYLFFCLSLGLPRSAWNGGSHDVHASVSDYSVHGPRGLQASQLWLLLGVLVSTLNALQQILHKEA